MTALVCPVRAAAQLRAAAPALVFGARTWTWREVESEVARWASRWSTLGVEARQRVGIVSANRPEVAFAFFGASRLGATCVLFNARLSPVELKALKGSSGCRLVLGEAALGADGPLEVSPDTRLHEAALASREVAPAALFTSGTTSQPRLIELRHANLRASAEASGACLGADPAQRWLGTLPLFHVGGLAMLYRCAVYGASLQLEPGFEVGRVLAALRGGDVTHASLVPTTLARVLEAAGDEPFPSSLRALLIGGGPMGPALLARARSRGLPVLQTYGLTEACSQVCTERPGDADGETSGPPLPGIALRIVDEAGAEVPLGQVGEIQVQGPTVAEGLGPWLATRDLGRVDGRGRLSVWARRVDLIVSGGENISPAELEGVLATAPGLSEVCVVPLADEVWGQVPIACVVPGAGFQAEALLDWAREHLPGFKRPRGVLVIRELPRNAGGKVLRRQLRDQVEAQLSALVPPRAASRS